MDELLKEKRYDFISKENKDFICAFNNEIEKYNFTSNNVIGNGYCWGPYMIVFSKKGVKSKKVIARIYIRENEIVLRLFLNDIDKHRNYIEKTPSYIKEVFINEHGNCGHCEKKKNVKCSFRKSYTIENEAYQKCSGVVFELYNPEINKLKDYIALVNEFYPNKKALSPSPSMARANLQ
jgi:hypothetical protein